jgi:hypothetical protein
MIDDEKKPAEAEKAAPTVSAAVAGSDKPAPRPKAVKAAAPAAKPTRKRAPAAAKPATPAAGKSVARSAAAKKAPPAKKIAHEPEPFPTQEIKKAKPAKVKKAKLVRDSFTMPDGEYAQIAALKARCLKAGVVAKKSEILRAAVASLAKLSDAAVLAAVRRLDVIKTGRPAKGSK